MRLIDKMEDTIVWKIHKTEDKFLYAMIVHALRKKNKLIIPNRISCSVARRARAQKLMKADRTRVHPVFRTLRLICILIR